MNNRAKIAAGTSGVGIVALAFHILHMAHIFSAVEEKDKNDVFKNAQITIIQTDSTGKKDTMLMEDYLKKIK